LRGADLLSFFVSRPILREILSAGNFGLIEVLHQSANQASCFPTDMVGLLLQSFFEVSLVDRVHELGADLADGPLRERQKLKELLPTLSFKTFRKVRKNRH
jgi:hypothetical protein